MNSFGVYHSQTTNNGLLPFFAREQLLHSSIDERTAVSFSFEPCSFKDQSVMKIENILDINHEVTSNPLRLVGCISDPIECTVSGTNCSISAGTVSSKTFTLHVSKSEFKKNVNQLSSRPSRRHQVREV